MRIDGPQRPSGPAPGQRARAGGGSGAIFDLGQAERPAEARQSSSAAATGGLDALIALQMVEDPTARKRRGVKRGRQMLDALDRVKLSVLTGTVPSGDLVRLVGAVEGRERDSEDPRLEEILDEIELRARVELAKLRNTPAGA